VAGGGLWIVNPVLYHYTRDIGEVTSVARDEGEAVPDGCATYHQVEIVNGAAGAAQAGFLGGIVLKVVRNGQNMAFKGSA
jgi:hypothetical protein